jgi:hypothetical protein
MFTRRVYKGVDVLWAALVHAVFTIREIPCGGEKSKQMQFITRV